ncbi:MAG TPA: metallopeptidase family protein [Holophaga sp.]|nr:metallopeptidase family protein [Holophaga sp.]
MRMGRREFEELVEGAMALIPEEFRPYLEGIPVVVEDEPSDELLDAMGVPLDETLFGLYEGPALDEEVPGSGDLPARIIVYRLPHLDEARNRRELEREVATTVLHEVAHRFGIEEERLEELGWD